MEYKFSLAHLVSNIAESLWNAEQFSLSEMILLLTCEENQSVLSKRFCLRCLTFMHQYISNFTFDPFLGSDRVCF